MRKATEKKKREIMNKVEEMIDMQASKTDPLGSYTGVPVDPDEKPVQDADDL